jgi:trans-2,3-dihydro-3-hydroxyanthranilate isomerase
VQIDVFTSQRLEGNPLSVFTDARGLTDSEMQDLARETNLQETTFVFPREIPVEAREGVKVRIFTPDEEIPFGGHPTLGTATVPRTIRMNGRITKANDPSISTIVLDLKVGKVPVSFREDADGLFGEVQQVAPVFGPVHDRSAVAAALGLDTAERATLQASSRYFSYWVHVPTVCEIRRSRARVSDVASFDLLSVSRRLLLAAGAN